MKQKTAGRVERRQKIQIAVVPTDLQKGLHSGVFLWVIFICPELSANSEAILVLAFSLSCMSDLHPVPLTGGVGAPVTSASGSTMPRNRCSLAPEAFGCSPRTCSKLRSAGAKRGLFRRWQEQVDGCHVRIVKLDMQQVRRANGGVSFPLEMGSAHYSGCVRKTSKYEPCHETDFQLFDYPEPFWCR